jgi:3-oxoacyl-[acyl-carrier protein] reductase
MIDLSGKIALITGASGGIGRATAALFHKLGAHVVISGSNLDKLEALGRELKNNYTIKACNLTKATGLLMGLDQIDILVSNAGITNDMLSIRMSDEAFDEVININLKACFILNRECIKKMLKTKYGRIINISSVVAVSGNPGQANYCASKAGMIGMSKALAAEVAAKNITVNCVAPGFIKTSMTDKLTDNQKEAIVQRIPNKNLGTAEEVAYAIAFLASEQASYITGQTLHVNGGLLMV